MLTELTVSSVLGSFKWVLLTKSTNDQDTSHKQLVFQSSSERDQFQIYWIFTARPLDLTANTFSGCSFYWLIFQVTATATTAAAACQVDLEFKYLSNFFSASRWVHSPVWHAKIPWHLSIIQSALQKSSIKVGLYWFLLFSTCRFIEYLILLMDGMAWRGIFISNQTAICLRVHRLRRGIWLEGLCFKRTVCLLWGEEKKKHLWHLTFIKSHLLFVCSNNGNGRTNQSIVSTVLFNRDIIPRSFVRSAGQRVDGRTTPEVLWKSINLAPKASNQSLQSGI